MDNQTNYTNIRYDDPEKGEWHTMGIGELKQIFDLPNYKEEIETQRMAEGKSFTFNEWGTEEYERRREIRRYISYINYLIKFKENPIGVCLSKRGRGKETNIYLMVDHACGMHKIGRSKNIIQREKTLGARIPKIECLFSFKGHVEDEKKLHSHFKAKRGRGEWFDLNDEDINYIKNFPKLKKHIEDLEPETYRQWRIHTY